MELLLSLGAVGGGEEFAQPAGLVFDYIAGETPDSPSLPDPQHNPRPFNRDRTLWAQLVWAQTTCRHFRQAFVEWCEGP